MAVTACNPFYAALRLWLGCCCAPVSKPGETKFAQRELRKPVCAGTATAAVVAYFVNRGPPTVDYENRRKTSSGGQRF